MQLRTQPDGAIGGLELLIECIESKFIIFLGYGGVCKMSLID